MRILLCAEEAPLPPFTGSRLHLATLLREIRNDHDVRVVAFAGPDEAPPGDDTVRLLPPLPRGSAAKLRRMATSTLGGLPMGVSEMCARMRGPLREELARSRPDVVHVDSAKLAPLHPELGGLPSVLAMLDAFQLNVEAKAMASRGLRRWMHRREAARARRFGSSAYRPFDRVVAVSEQDRRELLTQDPSLRVEVIPNGVDLEAFASDDRPRDPHRMLFTGVMSYAPNVVTARFLANEVVPRVRAEVPGATLSLVGRSPAPAVAALAREPGVEVVGEVPEMRPWLSGARVYVCPMRAGTGIKNKLLEAMANGLPCVATPLALQGIDVRAGREVLVADDAQGIAGHVVTVLGDDAVARRLGEAARAYVRDHHRWEDVGRAFSRLYRAVARERTREPGSPAGGEGAA